jgi:hypothetical protein
MKVLAISREAHAPAAVVRAARLLERFEVKQLMAATPLRDSCLSGPARLLDAIREWRQFFDAPKIRKRRPRKMSRCQFDEAVAALAKSHVRPVDGQYAVPVHPDNVHPLLRILGKGQRKNSVRNRSDRSPRKVSAPRVAKRRMPG